MEETKQDTERYYPGFGRLGYFIGLIVFSVIGALLSSGQRYGEPSLFPTIATFGGMTVLSFIRLQNIGKNPWLALVAVIPIFSFFFVFLPCLVCQEGYEENKTLDKTGRVLSAVIVGFFLLVVFCIFGAYLV